MSKPRVFSAAEKVVILKKHLCEKVPVSDLCDEHNCGKALPLEKVLSVNALSLTVERSVNALSRLVQGSTSRR